MSTDRNVGLIRTGANGTPKGLVAAKVYKSGDDRKVRLHFTPRSDTPGTTGTAGRRPTIVDLNVEAASELADALRAAILACDSGTAADETPPAPPDESRGFKIGDRVRVIGCTNQYTIKGFRSNGIVADCADAMGRDVIGGIHVANLSRADETPAPAPPLILGPRQMLTSAVIDYDWTAWTREVDPHAGTNELGKTLRLVECVDDYHFKSQAQRYASGLNVVIDTQKNLDDQLRYGYVTLGPPAAAPAK